MWISKHNWEALIADRAAAKAETRRIDALVKQVQVLTDRLADERLRAENAIDQLLARTGGTPITQTRMPDPNAYPGVFDEDPEELAALREDIKSSGIGEVLRRAVEPA